MIYNISQMIVIYHTRLYLSMNNPFILLLDRYESPDNIDSSAGFPKSKSREGRKDLCFDEKKNLDDCISLSGMPVDECFCGILDEVSGERY